MGNRSAGPWIPRFWKYVEMIPESGCWIWSGTWKNNGYGVFVIQHKQYLAHRLSWIYHYGKIPIGKLVCHKCDTPSCVNPYHLFLGTQKDNMQDCSKKKRGCGAKGNKHWSARLTEADVKEIRISKESCRALSKKYGVAPSNISDVRTGKTWSHI